MANKCMISQPMAGLTKEEILEIRDRAINVIHEEGYELENSYIDHNANEIVGNECIEDINIPLVYLGKSIIHMSNCQAVYFCKGWEMARGCVIEHIVAKQYGLICIYE